MFWKRKKKPDVRPSNVPPSADPIAPQEFALSAEQIQPLVSERLGGCIATDMITKRGYPVGFMYRSAPHNEMDSGWHFMSGHESDEYMSETANHGIYTVNTIANYDRSIIPHLNTPANCAFERKPTELEFRQVYDFVFPDE